LSLVCLCLLSLVCLSLRRSIVHADQHTAAATAMTSHTLVESLTDVDAPLSIEEAVPRLEKDLRDVLGADNFLSDVKSCAAADLDDPEAIAPWKKFDCKLYKSAAATEALRSLLRCTTPGTSSSFEDILSAIASGSTPGGKRNYCYLIGGQVRDVLRGQLSTDIDFNYASSSKEVALVTVAQEWPTKYKCIGDGVTVPNYVLIGDESSSQYLEGFCIDFNATKPCYTNDLTMNTLLYDLTNDVIIDKTGRGVADIHAHSLRLSLGPTESFEQWSGACITPGGEELRYLKFFLRAQAKGQPYSYDPDECASVVASLRKALRTNAGALGGFWLGYTLKAQLADAQGVAMLQAWVAAHGGPKWWGEQWEPLVRKCAAPGALVGDGKYSSPRTYFTMASGKGRRRRARLGFMSCLRCSARVQPASSA